jgi:ATP-dependent Zn protease
MVEKQYGSGPNPGDGDLEDFSYEHNGGLARVSCSKSSGRCFSMKKGRISFDESVTYSQADQYQINYIQKIKDSSTKVDVNVKQEVNQVDSKPIHHISHLLYALVVVVSLMALFTVVYLLWRRHKQGYCKRAKD